MRTTVNTVLKITRLGALALAIPMASLAQVPAAAGTAPDDAKIKSDHQQQTAADFNRALFDHDLRAVDSILGGKPDKSRTGMYRRAAAFLLENDVDMQRAEKYAAIAYELSRETYAHPADEYDRQIAPPNVSKASELMGSIAASKGDFATAMRYYTEKPDTPRSGSAKMEALYLLTVAHSDKYATVKQKLASKVSSGDFSPEIKAAVQLVYNKENRGKAEGFETYYDSLKAMYKPENDQARNEELSRLKKQMTGRQADDFSLFDTEGKRVILSSLKGKVVVLDFWATWCVPCLASFPAMRRVMDKYETEQDVVFLFVNTMEKDKDIKSWIAKFKAEHNYTFPILLDTDNKVMSSFHSMGLPTKAIIDREGIIRFTTVGFSGDAELVSELTDMIELTKSAK
ncbi:TlpA disulfide reductase family protein [Chitinophagaceae bacterium 26-R-25]|nr:TlpA disulfide reductase family protein [Chitinophagaceae bacterium 26-R-25]